MYPFKTIYHIFLDALFPASSAEAELFALSPHDALNELPPAPSFSGLAVELPGARAVFAYKDERVKQLVWNIKYKKDPRAVRIGGYALFDSLSAGSAAENASARTIVIPMPITERRRRERGFNQCELLTEEIGRLSDLNVKVGPSLRMGKDLLVRTHHASRQTLKDRSERIESAQGIFGVNEEAIERLRIELLKDSILIKDVPIFVIDDVITTGSTMKEALDTLKAAGFEKVYGLSVAH